MELKWLRAVKKIQNAGNFSPGISRRWTHKPRMLQFKFPMRHANKSAFSAEVET